MADFSIYDLLNVTNEGIQYIENAANNLRPTSVTLGSRDYEMKYNYTATT